MAADVHFTECWFCFQQQKNWIELEINDLFVKLEWDFIFGKYWSNIKIVWKCNSRKEKKNLTWKLEEEKSMITSFHLARIVHCRWRWPLNCVNPHWSIQHPHPASADDWSSNWTWESQFHIIPFHFNVSMPLGTVLGVLISFENISNQLVTISLVITDYCLASAQLIQNGNSRLYWKIVCWRQ